MAWQRQEQLIKRLAKYSIDVPTTCSYAKNYRQEEIERIVPHREPFLLIDRITNIDLAEQAIQTERFIDSNDPVFGGHFPGSPVYPGVLQIEMMGQAGLCLAYFVGQNSAVIPADAKPVKGLFTKVHHATFIQPVFPGDSLIVLAKMIEYDELLGVVSCQIVKNGQICSCSVLEMYFAD